MYQERCLSLSLAERTKIINVNGYEVTIVTLPSERIKQCQISWSEFLSERVLLVEGKNDYHVIMSLCQKHGVP